MILLKRNKQIDTCSMLSEASKSMLMYILLRERLKFKLQIWAQFHRPNQARISLALSFLLNLQQLEIKRMIIRNFPNKANNKLRNNKQH